VYCKKIKKNKKKKKEKKEMDGSIEDNKEFMALLNEEGLKNGKIWAKLQSLRKRSFFLITTHSESGIYIPKHILQFVLRDSRCFLVLQKWTTEAVAFTLLGDGPALENLTLVGDLYHAQKYVRILRIYKQVSTQLYRNGHTVHYDYTQTAEMIGVLSAMGHGVKTITQRLKNDHKFPPCNPRLVLRFLQGLVDEQNGLVALACSMQFSRKKRRIAGVSLNPDVFGLISSFLNRPKRLFHLVDFIHKNKGLNTFVADMF